MEVPGQLAFHSKQDSNLYCQPCDRDGIKESAYGYCQDCEEHLCESCYKHHRKPRPSRNHVLLDKDSMPQRQNSGNIRSDEITDFCTKHSDKPLEFFCKKHGSIACYVCVTLEHKHCNIDYIPEVLGDVDDEYKGVVERMEMLIEKCNSNVKIAENALVNLDQIYKKVVEDIKLFRKEINECLDRMENELIGDSKALAHSAKCKLENLKADSSNIAEKMTCSLSLLNSLNEEKKKNELFIEIKNVRPRLAMLSDKQIQTLKDNKAETDLLFIRNSKILNQLKNKTSLGKISTCKKPSKIFAVNVQYEGTINVKSSSDKGICNVVGMVQVSTSQMIVADYDNMTIKMIDVQNGTLISEISVSSQPQDVIALPQNKLAVTLWNEKCIQILSYTDTSLSSDRRIEVGERCYCVGYSKDKLVVGCGCNPGKMVILDLEGNFMHVFDRPGLINGPEKIIISSDDNYLYVCDYNYSAKSSFIKMDWHGNIVQRFEQLGYERPIGVQELEDGTLLVCYKKSNKIVRLMSSFKRCEIVGLEKENLNKLTAIAYSERDHKLYISCSSDNFSLLKRCNLIKIFNIKWI